MSTDLPREKSTSTKNAKPVPDWLKLRVREGIAYYVNVARRIYKRPFDMPTVGFDLRGRTGGTANFQNWHLRFNAILLVENRDEYLRQVVPHEVAHLISDAHFGDKLAPHGKEWQSVMRAFGRPPDVTHKMDTSNASTVKQIAYRCACQDHHIGEKVHNKIMAGLSQHTCRKCKTVVKPKDPLLVPKPFVSASRVGNRAPATLPRFKIVIDLTGAGGRVPTGGAVLPSAFGRPPEKPSERQVAYAESLARNAGVALPALVRLSKAECSAFIERMLNAKKTTPAGGASAGPPPETNRSTAAPSPRPPAAGASYPPTDSQIGYARSIASRKKLTIPPDVLLDKRKISVWIDANK